MADRPQHSEDAIFHQGHEGVQAATPHRCWALLSHFQDFQDSHHGARSLGDTAMSFKTMSMLKIGGLLDMDHIWWYR